MNTPIADFVESYDRSGTVRLHMPGHKGMSFLGCEHLDITEITGADALYTADGIIAQSEANAASLFGAEQTLYSTEGSSQCIRAMLYLALTCRCADAAPVIVAARNVHKAFIYAAALLDFEIIWLTPKGTSQSICGCPVTPEDLAETLERLPQPPAAVYVTSPDYLGGCADIAGFAEICHRYGTVLAVDNAHGAYLRFLRPSLHPLDLGADICCDSAHKTLPVLTGGAYLHISKQAPESFSRRAKAAMELFGSTSPSYLILASLDLCNRYLNQDYPARLSQTVNLLKGVKDQLTAMGWQVEPSDPLRLTLAAPGTHSGKDLADRLRRNDMECEFADARFLVLMVTPENAPQDLQRIPAVLGTNSTPAAEAPNLPKALGERVRSVRQALFSPQETIPVRKALGRICGTPTVSCPPAIPIVVSGERIDRAALELFDYYGIQTVDVVL